jgi:hypothetical protein
MRNGFMIRERWGKQFGPALLLAVLVLFLLSLVSDRPDHS